MTGWREHARLYGIVDLGYVEPREVEAVAGQLVAGGAGMVQLRAKGYGPEEIRDWARRVQAICAAAGVPFVVNDFPQIARDVGADGVHVGQDDGSLEEARKVVGERAIIGRSTHSVEQARAALAEGFDYIGFGPLFPTPTKLGRPGIGLEDIAVVEREVGGKIPVFCIGGIRRGNLAEVMVAGARRVVVVSDLLQAPDRAAATREVLAFIEAFQDNGGLSHRADRVEDLPSSPKTGRLTP